MAHDTSKELVSLQQFNNTLGYSLSTAEFQRCLKQVKFLEPKVGKFWQGTDAQPGIYIAIARKVRLLNDAGELIATRAAGESFGEITLFPEAEFKPYTARASVNLQMCFVPSQVLSPLMAKYPQIREHLWNRAQLYSSVLAESDGCDRSPTPQKKKR